MQNTIGASSFRANMSECMDLCDIKPIVIKNHSRVYIMMKEEHYIDLINKIRLPHIVETPAFVTTFVHFSR